jgi:hypothetical protein
MLLLISLLNACHVRYQAGNYDHDSVENDYQSVKIFKGNSNSLMVYKPGSFIYL